MSHQTCILKKTFIILAVLFVAGYGIFNSRFILHGPEITIEQLDTEKNTLMSPERTLFLKGKVVHSSFISINGRPIFIDEDGQFNEKLLLSSGVSIIDIYAKDKFGKEVRKKIDVLYQGKTPLVDYENVALAATVASTSESNINTNTDESSTSASTTTESIQEGTTMSTMMLSTTSPSGL